MSAATRIGAATTALALTTGVFAGMGTAVAAEPPLAGTAPTSAAGTAVPTAVRYFKFADSADVYVLNSDNTVAVVTADQYVQAGSPALTAPGTIPGARYVKFADSATVYVVFGSYVHRLNSSELAGAGNPTPGLPGTIPGAQYVKFSDSTTVYIVFGNDVHVLSGAEWTSAGSPTPGVPGTIPGARYVKFADSTTEYAIFGAQVHRLTSAEVTSAGNPATGLPGNVPGARYFKFAASASVFVTFGSEVHAVTGSEWKSAGSPAPGLPGKIPGGRYMKFSDSATVYAVFSKYAQAVTGAEWGSAGSPRPGLPGKVAAIRWVKFSDHPNIYAVLGNDIHLVTYAEWSSAGTPKPGLPGKMPGASYYKYVMSDTVYVKFGKFSHALSWAEFVSAGQPAHQVLGYQTPGDYVKVSPVITRPTGGFDLTAGMNGYKVRLVRQKFGLGVYGTTSTVDAAMMSQVAAWQQANGLPATGVVDLTTWTRMGFSAASWTQLDTYVMPLRVTGYASRSTHIEAFISALMAYNGSPYVWGGANAPGQGGDCSGVVLEALYAAGLDPDPIDTVKQAQPTYRTSLELFNHPRLMKVPTTQLQRGDLIFYGSPVHHVAVYLGGGVAWDMNFAGTSEWTDIPFHQGMIAQTTAVRPFP